MDIGEVEVGPKEVHPEEEEEVDRKVIVGQKERESREVGEDLEIGDTTNPHLKVGDQEVERNRCLMVKLRAKVLSKKMSLTALD